MVARTVAVTAGLRVPRATARAGVTGGSAPHNRQVESCQASSQRGAGPSPAQGVRGVANPVPFVPAEIRSPSHVSSLNRSASLSYHERSDSVSSPVSGSNNQLNAGAGAQYVADFSVRALTDLQFVKVRRVPTATGTGTPPAQSGTAPHSSPLLFFSPAQITRQEYQNGLTASRMDSCPQSPDSNAPKPDAGLPEKPEPSATADETTSLLNERNCLSRRSNHSPLENSI